jgi:hypothetical protein
MIVRRCSVVAVVVTGLLAAVIPAAHAATVSPSKWAPKFCTAVVDYQSTIETEGASMDSALSQTTDLATARDQIESFLGNMADAANTAKRELKAAGVPSSPNGGKISALFVSGLGASAKVFAEAQRTAAKLPTDSVENFKVKGKQLGVDLTDAGEELSKSFSGINKLDKGKKLEAAVKAAPECQPIL